MTRDESLPIGTITPEQRQIIADAKQGQAVEEYLQSEEAVHDVAALLDAHNARPFPDGSPHHHAADTQHREWWISRYGAWRRVSCRPALYRMDGHDALAFAYFRPEGDRYVVTDLGEAVRALRLRTGYAADHGAARGPERERLHDAACVPFHGRLRIDLCLDGQVRAVDDVGPAGLVAAADLPRAIVRVLLAAHRVASLEAP